MRDVAALAPVIESLALRGRTVLVGAGDIADCETLESAAATAALVEAIVAAAEVALVFTTGDHAYDRGTQKEFERCYGPTWGRFEALTRPSPGNHDYHGGAGPFYDYFSYFDEDPAARERGYYSYQLGGWHIVALNSILPMTPGAEQHEWLEQDLRDADADCILAYWHHPLFSSGLRSLMPGYRGRSSEPAWQVLEAHGADVVLNGHEHFYERYTRQNSAGTRVGDGIRQITVGTGGGNPQTRALRRENRVALHRGPGVLVMMLGAAAYEFAYVGTDGVIHDGSDSPIDCVSP